MNMLDSLIEEQNGGTVIDNTSNEGNQPEVNTADESVEDEGTEDPSEENGTEETTDNLEETSIYDDVSTITGIDIEGEFDDSVEGYAHYSAAVYDKALSDYDTMLSKQYPEAHNIMMHVMNGGKLEDLIAKDNNVMATVDNDASAEAIVAKDLESKGVSEAVIKLAIADHKEKGNLVDQANNIVKINNETLDKDKADIIARQEEIKVAQDELITKTANGLETIIDRGIFEENGIRTIIPAADKSDFTDYLMNRVQVMEDGSAVIVHTIEDFNDLKYDYFRYKRGNLDKLVERRAGDQNAKRLRRNAKTSNNSNNNEIRTFADLK